MQSWGIVLVAPSDGVMVPPKAETLDRDYNKGENLGDRLMVGQQTLDLFIMVRIHVPQPI